MTISNKSTKTESEKPTRDQTDRPKTVADILAVRAEPNNKTAEANAQLSEKLEDAEDGRKEERFLWIVVVVILVDVLWFKDSSNPTIPIVVLVLQLIILLVLARRMGIDGIVQLIDRILHTVGSRGTSA